MRMYAYRDIPQSRERGVKFLEAHRGFCVLSHTPNLEVGNEWQVHTKEVGTRLGVGL